MSLCLSCVFDTCTSRSKAGTETPVCPQRSERTRLCPMRICTSEQLCQVARWMVQVSASPETGRELQGPARCPARSQRWHSSWGCDSPQRCFPVPTPLMPRTHRSPRQLSDGMETVSPRSQERCGSGEARVSRSRRIRKVLLPGIR